MLNCTVTSKAMFLYEQGQSYHDLELDQNLIRQYQLQYFEMDHVPAIAVLMLQVC
jgi:hypothetical protein